MKRSQVDKKYHWDLSYLFKNEEDWRKELKQLVKLYEKINTFKGKLNNLKYFEEYLWLNESASKLASRLNQYLHLADIDTTNIDFINLINEFKNEMLKLQTKLVWIEQELTSIGQDKIMDMIKSNENLKRFTYDFHSFFRLSKYILDEKQEELLSKVASSRSLANEIYDLLVYADKKPVFIKYKGKKQELTETLLTEISQLSDPFKHQNLRKEASLLFNQHLIDKRHSLSKVYEGIITKYFEEVKLRNYDSSLQASLVTDEVSVNTYDTLLSIGKENIDLYRRFIKLKKKYFKLKDYYSTDFFLLMNSNKKKVKYSIKTAISILKEAFQGLGLEYLSMLDTALKPGRIDYYSDTNKRQGAYSSSGVGVEPIILMNWDNSLRSVSTLAHELGHSVHTLFSNKYQPLNLSSYPILLAEVASTFNEHILFDYLYNKAKTKEDKLYLLETRINDVMATFFRQIQFAEFEKQAHNLVVEEKPINSEVLMQLFNKISINYGYDVFSPLNNDLVYTWPRISHFFHSPFYVYKYATSIVASFKLYNQYLESKSKGKTSFSIIDFLKAGGHKSPTSILKDVGVDLENKNTYNVLIEHIKYLLDELEKLLFNSN